MKSAISFFSFGQDVNIREACEQAKQAGYEGVELCLHEHGSLDMQTSDKQLLEIRRMVNDMGLEVCSVGAWNLWEHNLAGYDEKAADYACTIIKKQIECAQAFGTDAVLIVPGWVGTIFAPGIVRYDHAYENAQKRLASLVPFAKEAGVTMAVENVGNKFLLSPLEMRRFIDEIGSEFVGAYFDVGNIISTGYPDQWIEILGQRIKRLHFCDCRANLTGLDAFVDLFAGDVDFPAVMQAAKNVGYDSWATVEFLPNYKLFPYQSIINARFSLQKILEM